jgi:hypothetical protein
MDADTELRHHIAANLSTLNATLVGRAFNTHSEASRQDFANWLIGIVDDLGLELRVRRSGWKPPENWDDVPKMKGKPWQPPRDR